MIGNTRIFFSVTRCRKTGSAVNSCWIYLKISLEGKWRSKIPTNRWESREADLWSTFLISIWKPRSIVPITLGTQYRIKSLEQAEYASRGPELVKEKEVVVPIIAPAVGTGVFLQGARVEAKRLRVLWSLLTPYTHTLVLLTAIWSVVQIPLN